MIVLAVLRHTGDYVQIGGGGVLIALGLYWMGKKRRGGARHNNRNQHE